MEGGLAVEQQAGKSLLLPHLQLGLEAAVLGNLDRGADHEALACPPCAGGLQPRP